MSSSLDGFVKVCTLSKLDLVCSLNICNPLPARWGIYYTKNRKRFAKIKKAMQTLKRINEIYRHEFDDPSEEKPQDSQMFLTQAFDIDYLISKYGD